MREDLSLSFKLTRFWRLGIGLFVLPQGIVLNKTMNYSFWQPFKTVSMQ